MKKRLFLFAAYNKGAEISQTLIDYLTFLSPLGDIVISIGKKAPIKVINSTLPFIELNNNIDNGTHCFRYYFLVGF